MYSNYFIYNGKKYYTGTVVKVRSSRCDTATFICHRLDGDLYVFNVRGAREFIPSDRLSSFIVSVTDKINNNVHVPVQKTFKDSDIKGLSLGWVWYIFLILISVLFKDCIKLWIAISILFFSWRALRRKKEGTYYDW